MKKILWLMPVLILTMVLSFGLPEKKEFMNTIAFYNVENLFDAQDDPSVNDSEFLPQGKYHWTEKRYKKKLKQVAKVIEQLGDANGPELIGLAEIENEGVLKELTESNLKEKKYGFIHEESCDSRGIDVALLYKKKYFKPLFHKLYSPKSLEGVKSDLREVLMVKGILNKDTIYVFVNHWTSRRSGKEQSERKRIIMGMLVRELCDSIFLKNSNAEILVMGDFNDTPKDPSINQALMAKTKADEMGNEDLYNSSGNLSEQNIGSIRYGKYWQVFDQIIMSKAFYKKHYEQKTSAIYHPDWMHYKNDLSKGPYRTFSGGKYQENGFSDHFPVFIHYK